jgi:alpha-beta hydrolase superfamily lysophospholipase
VHVIRGRRRTIFWALIMFGTGAWIGAAIYLGEIMLRLPHKPPPVVSKWEVAAPEDVEISSADGLKMRAWFFRTPQAKGTVIVLHGQTDSRVGMLGYINLFLRNGFNVLAPDLRAHGTSEGSLATYGLREADDVRRWVEWTKRISDFGFRISGAPGADAAGTPEIRNPKSEIHIYGFGESMGGAILLQTLTVESRFCSVVVEAPYASLREIAYDRLSQRYGHSTWPGRYLLRPILELALIYQRLRYGVDLDQVSPVRAVAHSHTPVLLIFGEHDDNTPVRHARSIHEGNPRTVTLWEVPNAGHTGVWGSRPKEFERRVLDWFNSCGPA